MRDDTYIGIDGKPWKVMAYPDALDIVTWIAEDSYHVDAEHQAWLARHRNAPDDPELERIRQAIETVKDFVAAFHEKLHLLKHPRLGSGWPEFVYADTPDLDPLNSIHAVRICLAAARDGTLLPSDREYLETEHGTEAPQRAVDMVRSLIGLHGVIISKWPAPAPRIASEPEQDVRLPEPA